jgi:hypothetical protein
MCEPNHLSNNLDTLKALGVNKIFGWDISLWKEALKQDLEDKTVKEFNLLIDDTLKNKDFIENLNCIEIKKSIELFSKRAEMCVYVLKLR